MRKDELCGLFERYRHSGRDAEANREGGRVPAEWKPIRYATREGWVLGMWTWRTRRGYVEIGLFVCEDHIIYKRGAAIKWSLRCILTQALYQVGSMEVRFCGKPPDQATLESGYEPVVPEDIRAFAEEHGIALKHRSRLSHAEGEQLYYAATDFEPDLIERFTARGLDPLQACALVQRDIWSMEQIRSIFDHAPDPDRIFRGGADPVDRLIYLWDLHFLRILIMAERMRILLEKFSLHGNHAGVQTGWCEQCGPPVMQICPDSKVTIAGMGDRHVVFLPGEWLKVMLYPIMPSPWKPIPPVWHHPDVYNRADIICVTKDQLVHEEIYLRREAERSLPIVPLFDTLSDLDREVDNRLGHTASSREDLAERHA